MSYSIKVLEKNRRQLLEILDYAKQNDLHEIVKLASDDLMDTSTSISILKSQLKFDPSDPATWPQGKPKRSDND